MAYATLQNLKDHAGADWYAALTDLAGGMTASDSVGQLRLDAAEAEVNDYLGQRFSVPIDVSDATRAASLKAITLAIALHKLYVAHPSRPDVPKTVQTEHDEAVAKLKGYLTSGALPGATEVPATPAAGTMGEAFGTESMFSPARMEGLL